MTAGLHAETGAATLRGRGLRRDVEGLRAVAILSVLAYHAGVPFLAGGFVGVDIFFVISGFLITALLVREAERSGRISLTKFYARRAKRLLPAAAVVFVVTAAGTAVLFSGSEARVFGGDIVAAAAYVVNWRLAARAVDYLAEDTGQSPVLHFWSLSVEEQYYVVWPVLAILAVLVARRFHVHLRSAMGVGLAIIAVPSFWWALQLGHADPSRSFFVTPTRLWELAVGASIALAAPGLARMNGALAQVLAFAGAAAILSAIILLHDSAVWPGTATLLPVLGTASVIAAGGAFDGNLTARVLGTRPMVWIGGLSYSLYLWHWPMLICAEQAWGDLRLRERVLISAFAVVPAYLSLRFVENPVRFSHNLAESARRGLLMGAALTAVGVIAGVMVVLTTANSVASVDEITADTSRLWGAEALGDDPATSPAGDPEAVPDRIVPAPADAPDDTPSGYEEGCQLAVTATQPKYCVVGDVDGSLRVLAVGDSKMFQYYDALDKIGKERGWRIEVATKSRCVWAGQTQLSDGKPYEACDVFSEDVAAYIASAPPDFVLTTGAPFALAGVQTTRTEDRATALASRWGQAVEAGSSVIVLLDPPRPPVGADVPTCVAENPDAPGECAYSRQAGVERSAAQAQVAAANAVAGVSVVSVSDYVCPRERCAPVVGDVLVLRQGAHITNTYALTLSRILGDRLAQVIDNGDQRVGPTFVTSG